MPVYTWSQTSASNATADPTINYAEGQVPSSLNDSARAMIAALRKYVDDISGAIVTGGTSTAYTVASYSAFDTLAHLSGQIIAFTPHATNGATVTLNVDGLGAKPLRSAPSVELQSNVLIQGTPYVAIYSNADSAFYLHGNAGSTCGVPLLGGMDYWDTVAPSTAFIFPAGQAISRSAFPAAFARWGTTYGSGDGSTTFNVPDKTGRASVMKEATATRLTTAGGGVDGGTMGATGGAQNRTLITANLPAYTPTGTVVSTLLNGAINGFSTPGTNVGVGGTATGGTLQGIVATMGISSAFTGIAQGGTSTPVITLPHLIVCNYVIRII